MQRNTTACSAQVDVDEILAAIRLLAFLEAGDVVELRLPQSTKGTISGYFDDPDKLAMAASELSGRFSASCYFTLNQLRRDLLARSANRLKQYSRHTTKDDEILRRRWLPVDFDPIRPAGISSTNEKHEAAICLAHTVSVELGEFGWPTGIIIDSGNGAQILYKIDLPNDEASAGLIQRVLKGLAERYNTGAVQIDTDVFNASRIWKLPGTLAMKGDSTAERPHRLARLLTCASPEALVTEQLTAVAIPVEPHEQTNREYQANFDLDALLISYGDRYKKYPWKGGTKYVFECCPNNAAHKNSFCVTQQPNGGGISAKCMHVSCADFDWPSYRRLREPSYRSPRENGTATDRHDHTACNSEEVLLSPAFSEDALALAFSSCHGDDLRYTASMGTWHRWDGCHWAEDETLAVFDLARSEVRAMSCGSLSAAMARQIAKASTVAAVERLARSDRRHAMTIAEWDADPWVLNTPSGIVDLKTGQFGAHRRDAFCTKITAAGVAGQKPTCWFSFLDRITDGDSKLQEFLKRVFGYALTGVTIEHAIFFLHGLGANGKSVFISTMHGVMGGYAKVAPIEMFTVTNTEQHPTERASLVGARLVISSEIEEGRLWAESKIKYLTGGDPISARFMRQDFFEYMPQFKLVIAGNRKPGLRTVDEGMRRRLHLIPFAVTIPKHERDLGFAEKLKAEWAGILGWGIEGCLEWQRQGLNPPDCVQAATAEYFAAEDMLGRWLEERTTEGSQYATASSVLYRDWKQWAEARNVNPGSIKEFSQRLQARGFQIDHQRSANKFLRVALRPNVITS